MEATVTVRYWGGDHLIIGRVNWAESRTDCDLLLFHCGSYATLPHWT
jgi:hypothetical protein